MDDLYLKNKGLEEVFRLRDLLEDFEVIAGKTQLMVLVSRPLADETLIENLQASIIATLLDLKSIDHVKRTYIKKYSSKKKDKEKSKRIDLEYINAYKAIKKHIEKEFSRLVTNKNDEPPLGVFGASIVLERLVTSFFSAHLLYKLGNSYEAHAVSRLILEQIAWAYAAHTLEDLNDIEKIVTTKAISQLKKIAPEAGKLYNFLSEKTHIDYDNHSEFITIEQERNVILLSHLDYYEYAKVILKLADLFGIVWEISQFKYMNKRESVKKEKGVFIVKQNRPFLRIIKKHLDKIEKMSKT